MMDEEEMSHASNFSGSAAGGGGPAAPTFGARGAYQNQLYGNSSVASDGDISLKRDREREGRCSECGVQTHEFRMDPQTGQPRKIPLSVEHEVHRGRCLLCHPLHGMRTPGGMDVVYRSTRSMATVSTVGSHSYNQSLRPDHIGSDNRSVASSVVSNSAIDECIHGFESEGCDLLDVLTAMRRFPNERRIQERGCEKLWIQSWDDENSSAIGRVGGISTLLSAMSNFTMSQRLQQSGCEALQNLAVNDYNRDAIKENGGISIIIQAMNNHPDVVGVQQCGCTALANLAASPDNHLDIANAGGLHAIMNAAQRNQEEEAVLRAAYQALRAMGYDPNRHGPPGANPQQQAQQQQQQNEPGVIRLDQHGFPIG